MGFSQYKSKETKATESNMVFVSTNTLTDSDNMLIAIGHYETDGKPSGDDKLYAFTYYTNRNGEKTLNKKPSVKLDMSELEEFYEVFKNFMES